MGDYAQSIGISVPLANNRLKPRVLDIGGLSASQHRQATVDAEGLAGDVGGVR